MPGPMTPAQDDTAEVVAAQQAWSESVLTNDADVVAQQLRGDGVIVTPDGIISADQFLTAIRASALSHTRMEAAQDPDGIPRVRVYGDTAVLTQRVLSTEVAGGSTRENDEWTSAIFVRADGRWQVALIHLTPAS
jgi:ketosteroid isomerase-like protein